MLCTNIKYCLLINDTKQDRTLKAALEPLNAQVGPVVVCFHGDATKIITASPAPD